MVTFWKKRFLIDVIKDVVKNYLEVTKAKGIHILGSTEVTKHNRCLTPVKVHGNKVLTHLDAFINSISCFCAS